MVWHDSLIAFVTFYHLVITKCQEPKAAEAVMNSAAGLPPGTFLVYTSKQVQDFHRQREFAEMVRWIQEAAEQVEQQGQ